MAVATAKERITGVFKNDSGWFAIKCESGRRYDTKRADLAREARELIGEDVEVEYTPRPRTGSDGTVYDNRLYERAMALNGAAQQNLDFQTDPAQTTSRKTNPGDAWRMCLNKGGELAVMTLPLLKERGFDKQAEVAYAWAKFFYFCPTPDGATTPWRTPDWMTQPTANDEPDWTTDPGPEPDRPDW